MNERWIKLIHGYVRDVDYHHPVAKPLDLRHRVAVMINAYSDKQMEFSYDTEVVMALLREVLRVVPHNNVEFDLDPDGDDTLLSLTALDDHYVSQPRIARESFWRGRAMLDDHVTCLIVPRNHCKANSPQPYRGSHTFSFYTKDIPDDAMTRACRAAAASCGIEFAEPIEGCPKPQISLLTRLHDFVVYDADQAEQSL